jgi:hypothetical protein
VTEHGRLPEAACGKAAVVKDRELRGEACFGCLKSDKCWAAMNADPSLKPGQAVETAGGRLLGQALAALLPLPLGFAAGFFLVPVFFPAAGDPAKAAGGVLLMFAAAAGYYLFRRRQEF